MSINRKYLPELDKLKTFLSENGSTRFFITYVKKSEVFIGSTDSMNFIRSFENRYRNSKNEEFYKIDN